MSSHSSRMCGANIFINDVGAPITIDERQGLSWKRSLARAPCRWACGSNDVNVSSSDPPGVIANCLNGCLSCRRGASGYLRRMRTFCAISLLALGCVVVAFEVPAQVSNKFQQSNDMWKRMDNCKRQAWKQYPDYSNEGSAKRDQAVKHCLQATNLPPVAPQSPAVGSGSPHQ